MRRARRRRTMPTYRRECAAGPGAWRHAGRSGLPARCAWAPALARLPLSGWGSARRQHRRRRRGSSAPGAALCSMSARLSIVCLQPARSWLTAELARRWPTAHGRFVARIRLSRNPMPLAGRVPLQQPQPDAVTVAFPCSALVPVLGRWDDRPVRRAPRVRAGARCTRRVAPALTCSRSPVPGGCGGRGGCSRRARRRRRLA